MIRALIVDDHAVVRAGLKQILADQLPTVVPTEAKNAKEAMELVSTERWDIVILDITLPDKSGLDVIKELKQLKADLPILVLSIHPEEQFATRVLKAGAAGYITKESASEELVIAIQKVLVGRKYISADFGEQLATELGSDTVKFRHETLSDREYQILCLLATGETASEIAQRLSLSIKTVSTYRTRILEKMNMKSNAQLTHYALKHHLIEEGEVG